MLLRDSLSNPGTPLLRLATALRGGTAFGGEQAQAALIAQTGAVDPAPVKMEVKENRKLSPSEIDDVVARYQAGGSIRILGETLGLHEQTVRAHLRRQGVALRPVRALTDEQEGEVVRLYIKEMWTLAELAGKFGVSAAAVRQVLVRRGVERRAQARRRTS